MVAVSNCLQLKLKIKEKNESKIKNLFFLKVLYVKPQNWSVGGTVMTSLTIADVL